LLNHDLGVNHISAININSPEENGIYKQLINHYWDDQAPIDIADGDRIFRQWFRNILSVCDEYDEVVVMDRNLFLHWNVNYVDGLKQFRRMIKEFCPICKLKIITQKSNSDEKTPFDIYREIKNLIEDGNLKTEIIICKGDETFEKDRFILIKDRLAGMLNKGIDSFVPSKKYDRIRISYMDPDDVDKIFSKAISKSYFNGDFKPIRNYA